MAWTAPRTWVTGEIPTAAVFNIHLRDNFLEAGPAKVTTSQDIVVGAGAGSLKRLAVGATNARLRVQAGGAVGWVVAAPPTGTIILFDGTTCPSGWSEIVAARGRAILGLPSGGTLAGTVGTALGDGATRTITEVPSHDHGIGTYSLPDPGGHIHTVDIGSTVGTGGKIQGGATGEVIATDLATESAGGHTHTLTGSTASAGSASVDVTMPYIQYLVCRKD